MYYGGFMKIKYILLIIIVAITMFYLSAEGEMNDAELKSRSINNQNINETAVQVSRYFQRSICIEEKLNAERKSFSLNLEQASLDKILNEIVLIDENYIWETDEKTGIINIYPKQNDLLNWKINYLSIKGMSVKDIFMEKDLLELKKHNIEFFTGRGNLSWLDAKITLNINDLSARDVLNLLCKQLPFKARWQILKIMSSTNKGFLTFHGYGIKP